MDRATFLNENRILTYLFIKKNSKIPAKISENPGYMTTPHFVKNKGKIIKINIKGGTPFQSKLIL